MADHGEQQALPLRRPLTLTASSLTFSAKSDIKEKMAALTRHASLRTDLLFVNTLTAPYRAFFREKKKFIAPVKKATLEASQLSLAAKGFLRSYKQYDPINNVSERVNDLCKENGISTADETHLENSIRRFNLLVRCEKEFQHTIPNSILYNIETIGNLREFYNTPVNTTVPLDAMRFMDLPKNLHVQYKYHRFEPETDTMFNGKTAFPKSSTIVTGLKYKNKYRGHSQKSLISQ